MTDGCHPVRKRTGVSELNALLLPLVLLVPALTAVFGQFAVVASAPTRFEADDLRPLRPPAAIPFERTRRIASAHTGAVLEQAVADLDGTTAAQHVAALARHDTVADRPTRGPRFDTLARGESVEQFRRRWRLPLNDLVALNPGLDLEGLQHGDSLCVWRADRDMPSRSVGRPNRGQLIYGEPMPEGVGWVVRHPAHAYGARQTIDALVDALRTVAAEHPGGQDMMIADVSRQGGGRMLPHRSHQSGRDVDVTYYRLTDAAPTFTPTRASELDLDRTWTFVRTLLLSHDVDYIFMSQALQRVLYDHATASGEHPAFLDEVFQRGTNGHRNHRAVIRFAPGHYDHIHIRFGCAPQDVRCGASAG